MSDNNVRSYTDEQILNRVKEMNSFVHIPQGYWFCFIRSNEDAYNKFDDKAYMFKGETFIGVTSCTTNSGAYGLKNFRKWNKHGAALLKADMWYYTAWMRGMHKGKMQAWRQTGAKVAVYRDSNGDHRTDAVGKVYWGYFGINIHTVSYNSLANIVKRYIGGWSVGCMVLNATRIYRKFLSLVDKSEQKEMTACVLTEFKV